MRWLEPFLGLDHRRRRLLARSPPGPLRDFLAVPFPPASSDCRAIPFVAVDLETTGVDPRTDEILSVGWVCAAAMRIDLSTAAHRLVRPTRAVRAESAVLHRITDDAAARGLAPAEALAELLAALAGKVLVAHNAEFELRFLDAACERALGGRFLAPAVDTLSLAAWRVARSGARWRRGELRLDALRRRHNLPRYRAHDALSDALAAAELFLAQIAERGGGGAVRLRSVLFRP